MSSGRPNPPLASSETKPCSALRKLRMSAIASASAAPICSRNSAMTGTTAANAANPGASSCSAGVREIAA